MLILTYFHFGQYILKKVYFLSFIFLLISLYLIATFKTHLKILAFLLGTINYIGSAQIYVFSLSLLQSSTKPFYPHTFYKNFIRNYYFLIFSCFYNILVNHNYLNLFKAFSFGSCNCVFKLFYSFSLNYQ